MEIFNEMSSVGGIRQELLTQWEMKLQLTQLHIDKIAPDKIFKTLKAN